MWKLLLYALLIWFLYNLVFRFIIPVYLASKKMKQQFRAMQNKMQEEAARQQGFSAQEPPPPKQSASPRPSSEDYIDFEEVR